MYAAGMTIRRIGGRIGAEFLDVDLAQPISSELAAEINSALVEHKVLVFRGQNLDDEAHVRFSTIFGALTTAHPTVPSVDGQTNVLEVAGGEGARANTWHTDVTFVLSPPKATTLRSLVIPSHGGDTLFSNTAAAYQDLPPHLRVLADQLWAVHSNEYDYAEHPQFRTDELDEYQKVFTSTRYRTAHPVVRINPDSNTPNLFIGGSPRESSGCRRPSRATSCGCCRAMSPARRTHCVTAGRSATSWSGTTGRHSTTPLTTMATCLVVCTA